ncbi:uncharacterized mitochondrial protein AtMg00810 [Lathyrus oleraceus]|uniref:uncharacterized mitochondrial protein AtMg00810 n=1 Tax=Pisum sativum TaxID=3888 RepID=UPI0021D2ADB7|nr:uncharacterized mitochondrial protein AtMg00810-like [Pisum sativum]
MECEIASIEKNGAWELTDLPTRAKKIGVKRVFKTKMNEIEEVDKCKARLVAKDYAQQAGIDYTEAPRAWFNKIESYFFNEGFERSTSDHTLFTKKEGGRDVLIMNLYVDGLIFRGSSEKMFQEFKSSMKREFEMTDLGCMRYFLGVEVTQNSNGIFICQRKYVNEVLEMFGLQNCSSVTNPIVPGCKLTKDAGGLKVDATTYKQMVGSLMYLTATRPDLVYVVSLVARFLEAPTTMHQQTMKRVLRYLRGTTELGLCYKREGEENLVAFCDSDYAGDLEDRKSTSGYVFKMSNGLVAWSSKKQSVVSLSTTEAEFISVAACVAQSIWMMRILESLGVKQSKCIIFCDNSSTIKLSKNPVMHGKSKHIHVRFHFLRELANQGEIELVHCGTKNQLADIMTKTLNREVFMKLREIKLTMILE